MDDGNPGMSGFVPLGKDFEGVIRARLRSRVVVGNELVFEVSITM